MPGALCHGLLATPDQLLAAQLGAAMAGEDNHILVVHPFPYLAEAVCFHGAKLIAIRIAVAGIGLRPTDPTHTNQNRHAQ